MNVVKCANGHFFDADVYAVCPHCVALSSPAGEVEEVRNDPSPFSSLFTPDDPAPDPLWKQRGFDNYDETNGNIQDLGYFPGPPPAERQDFAPQPTFGKQEFAPQPPFEKPEFAPAPQFEKPEFTPAPQFEKQDFTPAPQFEKPEFAPAPPFEKQEFAPAPQFEKQEFAPQPPFEKQEFAPAPPEEKHEYIAEEKPQRPTEEEVLREVVKRSSASKEGKTLSYFNAMTTGKTDESASSRQDPIDPVVGWMVCIEGKHFGESFEIKAGMNSIGRESGNKIVLSNDESVSRDKHALITYEPKHREFYLKPGDSSGLTYLNDEYITETKKLSKDDTIEIGNCKFIFVPLCGDSFTWEDHIKM